ncbi:MAG: TIGR03936 family radical SAM-associated protein [Firmicutes bacterium]|nr:TIGR03936 family radical SAM-associated protein [Bacillota bacterium]
MTNRYVIKFSKDGYVKYTSHLDMMRVFRRAFKKTGLALRYSQGFNPHPKMGFAQPLSLGYASRCELIEFETQEHHSTEDIMKKMIGEMPEGIKILSCQELREDVKSLAADADAAEYKIWIPSEMTDEELKAALEKYLAQEEIITLKRQKKTKKMAPVNIKNMLRHLEISKVGEFAMIKALLDCGSQSNCSPELVIASFCESAGITTPRHEMEVERLNLYFVSNLQF